MLTIKTWSCLCYLLLATGIGTINAQEASLVLPVGHSCPVAKVVYSADSKYLFSLGEDGSAKLWEAESGLLIHDFKAISNASMNTVSDACFDRSGKNLLLSFEGYRKVWDLASGKFILDSLLSGGIENFETLLQHISPDGEHFIVFGIESQDTPACIYNSREQIAFQLKGAKKDILAASFSSNGKKIATISEDGRITLWDGASGKQLQTTTVPVEGASAIEFFPNDQRVFITSGFDNYLFDFASNKLTHLKGSSFAFSNSVVKYSSNQKLVGLLYAYQYNNDSSNFKFYYDSLLVWDAVTGKQLSRIGNVFLHRNDEVFTSNDNAVASLDNHNTIDLSNATSTRKLRIAAGADISAYCFSPGGKFIAVADDAGNYYLFETESGKTVIPATNLKSLAQKPVYDVVIGNNGSVTFACDEHLVSYANFQQPDRQSYIDYASVLPMLLDANFLEDNQTIHIKSLDGFYDWNVMTGNVNFTEEKHSATRNKFAYENSGYEVSPDSSAYLNFQVDIISIEANHADGSVNHIYENALKETIRSAHFSPDSKKVILTMHNNSIKVIDVVQKKMLFNLFPLKTGGYISTDAIQDSAGYYHIAHFDGSDAARKQLYLACGTELITLDQLKDLIWVPNLAQRLMKGEAIQAKALSELDICGFLPLVEQLNKTDEADTYKITPRRGGIGEITVLVNGTPTKTYHVNDLIKHGNYYELLIPKKSLAEYFIDGSDNKITVKAFTADNSIASRGVSKIVVLQKTEKVPPNLYAVLIGVSQYKSDELKLKYAAKDATDFSKILGASAGKLLNTDTANHVFIYNMTTLDDRYRLPEKNAIKNLVQSIGEKAKPNDIVVIFFAGHGVMAKDSSGSQFYFLTAEASTLSANRELVKDVGISTGELADWMAPVHMKAQKRILIFDACNSGQAIRDMVSVGANNQGFIAARNDDAARQIKAIDKLNEKSGLFILSASASDQNAYESSKYAQGFLTYSLLKTIKDRPDILDAGEYLDVSRWFNAAKEYVGDMAKEAGERQEPQIVSNTNFNIGIVDNDVRSKIVLPEGNSIFTGSNFQNSDDAIADDNLDINSKLNKQLQQAAAKDKSSIMYLIVSGSPNAFSLTGRYTISGYAISANVNLKKGKEIIQRFEINGQQNDLEKFAADIVSKAIQLISTSPE